LFKAWGPLGCIKTWGLLGYIWSLEKREKIGGQLMQLGGHRVAYGSFKKN